MNYTTEQKILKVIKEAVSEEVQSINEELLSLRKMKSLLLDKTKEVEKLNNVNKYYSGVIDSYRNFTRRLEMTPFDSIEEINNQEMHVNEYWEWWWFYEMWYKVITKWEEDEIFILESWIL